MTRGGFVSALLHHFKFFDIFLAFSIATLLFACRCQRRPRFWLRVVCVLVPVRVLSLVFAELYGGSIGAEAAFSAVLIVLLIAGLLFCYEEKFWTMLFYFGSGFMTWYVTDRLFLTIESLCRLDPALSPYFVENTIPHILLYIGSFIVVYLFMFFTFSRTMRRLRGSEIPRQNSLLLFLLVCILTPIFYFESQAIAHYNLFFYNMLNLGEVIFYIFMLFLQIQLLDSARERTELYTMQKLLLDEQRQYRLTKENIEAINIKCHDLKHQIRHLRETGQVDPDYLDDLERSVSVYNSAVRTGNETLDIVLTDKRLHCATHDIQFTCIAEGGKLGFMDTMDVYSLFGNLLDNAIEHEIGLPQEKRFIHLSVRGINRLLLVHVENHLDGPLEFQGGVPVTTKDNKDYHGFGMLSIQRIVKKYNGSFSISAEDHLFQIDIMLPMPAAAPGGGDDAFS